MGRGLKAALGRIGTVWDELEQIVTEWGRMGTDWHGVGTEWEWIGTDLARIPLNSNLEGLKLRSMITHIMLCEMLFSLIPRQSRGHEREHFVVRNCMAPTHNMIADLSGILLQRKCAPQTHACCRTRDIAKCFWLRIGHGSKRLTATRLADFEYL